MTIAFRDEHKQRMEVKNRLSEAQIAVRRHLEQAGHGYHCSSDYRDVIEV